MLSVLLTILKIIGIVLLAIIGFVLLLVLTVLLVPLRYRASGHKEEGMELNATVGWLLHLLHVDISFDGKDLSLKVKVFGVTVYPKKEKPKKSKKKRKKKSHKEAHKDIPQKPVEAEKEEVKEEKVNTEHIAEEKTEAELPEVTVAIPEESHVELSEQELSADEFSEDEFSEDEFSEDEFCEDDFFEDDFSDEYGDLLADYTEPDDIADGDAEKKKNKQKKSRDKRKKRAKRNKTESEPFSKKWNGFIDKLKKVYNKFLEVKQFIDNPKVHKTVKVLKKKIVQVFKHILPRRIKGYIEFGFEDPAYTGYVTALLGAVYGIYGRSFNISPDFETKKFNCKGSLRGHIRLMTLLLLFINVVLRPSCRYTYKQIKKMTGRDEEGDD